MLKPNGIRLLCQGSALCDLPIDATCICSWVDGLESRLELHSSVVFYMRFAFDTKN